MPVNRLIQNGLPDIEGLSANPEEILNRMIARYEAAYLEQTGQSTSLAAGSPIRIWLYTIALQQYLLEDLIKFYASQNYLSCATGVYLDHISATRGGPPREGAKAARVTMRFTFSVPLPKLQIIPAGTRVTPDGSFYFALEKATKVEAGAQSWEQVFVAQQAGVAGNGYAPGQIATLSDPLPFVQGVQNIDTSQGGVDVQTDAQYADLIYLSPEGYAVAGPQLAYEYLAKKYSTAIVDVRAYRSAPGEVTIVPLLEGGELPEPAFLEGLLAALSDKEHRPLTDYVHTAAPTPVEYQIEFTWYLAAGSGEMQDVHQRVSQAVADYVKWQGGMLGRDINPDELVYRVKQAGAKRLELLHPSYTVVDAQGVALAGTPVVTFGGIEGA